LIVRAEKSFDIAEYLEPFAAMCRRSKEYQGHGWGAAYRSNGAWRSVKHLEPIWENSGDLKGECRMLLLHARSAFRNEGICLENNMPFQKQGILFAFNGELHGVRIRSAGRTGAEKLFNYILRFRKHDLGEALARAMEVMPQRTRYIKAMNIVMTDGERIFLYSRFAEDPDYFMLHTRPGAAEAFCSQPLGEDWLPVPNCTLLAV
jgi:glutamine amidotransferase